MLAGALPEAELVAIEVQPVSFELLERNVSDNGLQDRIRPVLADLREVDLGDERFDLVTGSPPFMPLGSGVLPQDPQRAAARFELRGGIEEYCQAAARWLAPGGTTSLLMDAARPERYRQAFAAAGLALRRVISVLPRDGEPATYLVHQGGLGATGGAVREETLVVRGPDDAWTEGFAQVREALDLPT